MDIHGGLTEAEQKTVDFRKTALSLLLTEEEKITPYGVVYNNGTLRNSSTCSTISPVSPPPWNTGGT